MTTIETLRNLHVIEVNSNFPNGQFQNDLEDMIYKLENGYIELETIQGDMYGAKELKR